MRRFSIWRSGIVLGTTVFSISFCENPSACLHNLLGSHLPGSSVSVGWNGRHFVFVFSVDFGEGSLDGLQTPTSTCKAFSHQPIPVLVDKHHDSLETALGELPGGVGGALEECLQLGGSHPLIRVRPGSLGLVSFARQGMTTEVCGSSSFDMPSPFVFVSLSLSLFFV